MSVGKVQNLEEEIISCLKDFSGRRTIHLDDWISRDIGIYGGDGVEILYELEDRFKVDLNALIDAATTYPPPTWWDRLCGRKHGWPRADVTVRAMTEYIAQYRGSSGMSSSEDSAG